MDVIEMIEQRLREASRQMRAAEGPPTLEGLGGKWAATLGTVRYSEGTLELTLEPVFEATSGPTIEFGYFKPSKAPQWGDCSGLSPEALTAAVWSGEGLPPVGCECEAYWGSGEYLPVKILADDEGAIVFRWKAGKCKGKYGHYSELRFSEYPAFRPLRTAEQLAAEAREKAIDIMQEHYERAMTGNSDRRGHASRAAIAALHDAGYRKSDA